MKRKLLVSVLLLGSILIFSQDYKQKLSKSSCECLKSIETDGKNKEKQSITTMMGLCMFKVALPFSKEIKRDYNIDLSKDIGNEDKMKDFGVQMGMLMLNECMDLFTKITKNEKSNRNEDTEESDSQLLLNGTVTKIEKDNFVIFHVVGDNKNLNKFYWVSNVESNLDLPKEYNSLINKKVNISYYTTEIFDMRINEYRNLNIISSLKTD